jgi:hypothetical protein
MPISTDEFEHLPEQALDLTEGSNSHRVLMFLVDHPNEAFRQTELIDGADVKPGSIGPVLARLEASDLVKHKGKYWTIANDDRLASFAAMGHTFATVEDRFPTEEMDEWLEYAENPYAEDPYAEDHDRDRSESE